MIFTSYYACKNKPPELKKIVASRIAPRWFDNDGMAKELAPSKELLFGYKKGDISKDEYTRIYWTQLEKLNADDIAKKYDNQILYCYEKSTDFCHRHIIRKWLKSKGHESMELPTKVLKIAVVGSRTFDNYQLVEEKLNGIRKINDFIIITGGAIGVDKLAEHYAKENNVSKVIFSPDKNKHGKDANRKRNTQIVSAADIIVAFWDGVSKGTKAILELAKKSKKEVVIVHIKDNNV